MVAQQDKSTSNSKIASTQNMESGGRRTRIVKKIIVERRRVPPSPEAQYTYELDPWEKLPKTDYTYARSFTYDRNSPKDVEPPNMSRDRLRGDKRASADTVRQRLFVDEFVLQTNQAGTSYNATQNKHSTSRSSQKSISLATKEADHSQQSHTKHERRNLLSVLNDASDDDVTGHDRASKERVAYSATRSGRAYRYDRSLSSLVGSAGSDDVDALEAKRREYAGLSTGYKESSHASDQNSERSPHRIQLYGLDNGEEEHDYSDTESSQVHSSESRSTLYSVESRTSVTRSLRSAFSSFYEYMLMVLSAVVYGAYCVVTSPYYVAKYVKNTIHSTIWRENHVHFDNQVKQIEQTSAVTERDGRRRSHVMSTRSRSRTSFDSTAAERANVKESREQLLATSELQSSVEARSDVVDSPRMGVLSTLFSGVKTFHQAVYRLLYKLARLVYYGLVYVLFMLYSFIETAVLFVCTTVVAVPVKSYRAFIGFLSALYAGAKTIVLAPYSGTKTVIASSYARTSSFLQNIVTVLFSRLSSFFSVLRTVSSTGFSHLYCGSKWLLVGIASGCKTTVGSVTSVFRSGAYASYSRMRRVASSSLASSSSALAALFNALKNVLIAVLRLLLFLPMVLFRGLASAFSNTLGWVSTSRDDHTESAADHVSTRVTRSKSARLSQHITDSGVVVSESQLKGNVRGLWYESRLGRALQTFSTPTAVTETKRRRRKSCALCCCLPLCLLLPLLLSGLYYVRQNDVMRDTLRIYLFGGETVEQAVPLFGAKDCQEPPGGQAAVPIVPSLTEEEIRAIIAGMLSEKERTLNASHSAIYSKIIEQQGKLENDLALLAAQLKSQGETTHEQTTHFATTQDTHSSQFLLINNRLVTIEGLIKKLEADRDNQKLQSEKDKEQLEAALLSMRADVTSHSAEKEAALMALFKQLESSVGGRESELRALFVDIVKAELAGYASKDEMDARLLDITTRIEQLSATNNDLKTKMNADIAETNVRVTGLITDLDSLTAKINEWNSKLDSIKIDLESKIASNNESSMAHAQITSVEIAQLQQAISLLNSEIESLKSVGLGKTEDTASKEEELRRTKAEMLYKEELVEIRSRIESICDNVTQAAAQSGVQANVYQGLSEDQINGLISKAIATYHADRTGKVDFALESAGGSIVSIRCSETYPVRTMQLSVWGIPLWYTSPSPRSIIQPDVYPGQCWAMTGSKGYVVISLSAFVDLTGFSLEHIPKELAPEGNIKSAPRDFSVWGLEHVEDFPGTNLGNYTYQEDGDPIQHFPVQATGEKVFSFVELRIHSNWGHAHYTCLYRFRVHGRFKTWVHGPHKESAKDEL